MNLCVPIPSDWVSAKPSEACWMPGAATTDIYVIERRLQ